MTDPVMADATYIEPLNIERLEQIIAAERPDALLPNLGGQTGLNMAFALNRAGILEKYGVQVIGVNLGAIERGEDRQIFKQMMQDIGIDTPKSGIANTLDQAEAIATEIGWSSVPPTPWAVPVAASRTTWKNCVRSPQAALNSPSPIRFWWKSLF
jgi:carbamoyl-phosphate synthase large subunit